MNNYLDPDNDFEAIIFDFLKKLEAEHHEKQKRVVDAVKQGASASDLSKQNLEKL